MILKMKLKRFWLAAKSGRGQQRMKTLEKTHESDGVVVRTMLGLWPCAIEPREPTLEFRNAGGATQQVVTRSALEQFIRGSGATELVATRSVVAGNIRGGGAFLVFAKAARVGVELIGVVGIEQVATN